MEQKKKLAGKSIYSFQDLIEIMGILTGKDGCPWDRAQTHDSIKKNLLEEAYEVIDAIESRDIENLKEELGDLLLQAVFHAVIAKANGNFDIYDVIDSLCKKLIFRHTHIFGLNHAENPEQALNFWEKAKAESKPARTVAEDIRQIPASFTQLMRAQKAQKKAAKTGYDFSDISGAMGSLKSEISELEQALASNDKDLIEEEIGDSFFSLVNICRLADLDAELALKKSTEKFVNRFSKVEEQVLKSGKKMTDLTIEEIDKIYNSVKDNE